MSDAPAPNPPGSTKNGRAFMFVGLALGLALAGAYYYAATRRFT